MDDNSKQLLWGSIFNWTRVCECFLLPSTLFIVWLSVEYSCSVLTILCGQHGIGQRCSWENGWWLLDSYLSQTAALSLWLSGLIRFLSHITCWTYLAGDLQRPGIKSGSRHELSVSWINNRCAMRLISRTGTEGPPVSSLNCDRCRFWSYDITAGYKCEYYYYYYYYNYETSVKRHRMCILCLWTLTVGYHSISVPYHTTIHLCWHLATYQARPEHSRLGLENMGRSLGLCAMLMSWNSVWNDQTSGRPLLVRLSMSGGSDFRPASMRRDMNSNVYFEPNFNLDDMFYSKNVIKHSGVFQWNF